MRLWNKLLTNIGLRRPQPQITRSQAMEVMPIRNPNLDWEHNEEGNAVVTLTRRAGIKGKLVSFFLAVPQTRPIVLDDVGTFVWDMCDGNHNVSDIVEALCEKHKLSRREVEVSLNEYLRMLGKRGMIAVAVPKDIMGELSEESKKHLGIQEVEAITEGEATTSGSADQHNDINRVQESSDPSVPNDD